MRTRQIFHVESGDILIPAAKWCDSFGSKLRGFTFRRELGPQAGLVLVEAKDNRVNTAIHMLFVFRICGDWEVHSTTRASEVVCSE